jgi:hypothetical protein
MFESLSLLARKKVELNSSTSCMHAAAMVGEEEASMLNDKNCQFLFLANNLSLQWRAQKEVKMLIIAIVTLRDSHLLGST